VPTLHCPSGHQWQSDAGLTCPICGAGPDGLTLLPNTAPNAPYVEAQPGPVNGLAGYEVLCELGRGGMGVVYKARQKSLNRVVALKMILAGAHAGPTELARFRQEAEAVARLRHPNVVQIHEIGEQDGLPFISLEFVDGGSLESRLRGKPLPPADAARLVEALARAVQAAHDQNVVHRDLKPANVLLSADGTPKITDFGLAKKHGERGQTQTGNVMGTPSYMAPEQASASKQVGPAADVWALGAILYECLTGRPPFRAANAMDTIIQVLGDDPAPPRQIDPAVPRDLEAVCLKCLEKDPARRYDRAADLADDLRRFLDGEPVRAQQSGLIVRLAGSLDRVQLKAPFGVYGALLLWLAPVMVLPEVWVTVVVVNDWSLWLSPIAHAARATAFLLLVGRHRGWSLLPRGAAERQLWAIWGGYLAACFAMGLSNRLALLAFDRSLALGARMEPRLYPSLAALTALAFFAMAPSFWGYCAVVGAGFLALAFVMAIDLTWAPLEFGAAWAAVLLVLGVRLRRLARSAPSSEG
jgi:tRNA A-37 threonylcarbamoyl transferase component Bud32